MKVAILGTRGIPNNYGGFEQLAEHLSLGLIKRGHQVYVYNSNQHPYKQATWQGTHIIHCFDPEKWMGTSGQFIYDLACILDSRKRGFDAIINLGYTSSSVWMRLFDKKARIITNMDGLEWKRTKYRPAVQRFLQYAEKLAVKNSHLLISDSRAIGDYLMQKYKAPSVFIAYGAHLFKNNNKNTALPYGVQPFDYNMLIARMEPENNIEMILDGMHHSLCKSKLLVVGNNKNKFGSYLTAKYANDERIAFVGSVYETQIINDLRYFSNIYFHGHSVGGTNPSLLEAMGCGSLIAAHDNVFNRSVLGNDAFYFKSSSDIKNLLETVSKNSELNRQMIQSNCQKVEQEYSWQKIVEQYEKVLPGV